MRQRTDMKAWVLHDIGDIRFEEIPEPSLQSGEVLVRVADAGICGSDIPRTYDTGAHVHPLVIGHEFSGTVEKLSDGVPAEWMHRRVGVFPLIPCGKCGPCQKRKYEMCRHYDYIGSRRDGAFGEYVRVPARNLIALPDGVSMREAAMLEPMAVAVHAIRRASGEFALAKDAKIAVLGLGTIGLLTVMFLLDAGYENLYVIGNKEFQLAQAVKIGIPYEKCCNSRKQDMRQWLANIAGAELVFECVGSSECILRSVEAAAPGGTVMAVGNPASDIRFDRQTYWKILRNQLSVLGTWNSSFTGEVSDDWHYVLQRLESGYIKPENLITRLLPLSELEEGLLIMRDKKEDYVKVMTELSET